MRTQQATDCSQWAYSHAACQQRHPVSNTKPLTLAFSSAATGRNL